jgi:hypothetical protein
MARPSHLLGEVLVLPVARSAASEHRDAEEVQQRPGGVDGQARARSESGEEYRQAVEEARQNADGQPRSTLDLTERSPQQGGRLVAYSQIATRMTAIATRTAP